MSDGSIQWDDQAAAPASATPTLTRPNIAAPAPAPAPATGVQWDDATPAATAAPTLTKPDAGDFMRGFKTSAHQLPQLGGGALAFGGDVLARAGKAVGGDGAAGDAVTKYGLDVYKKQDAATQALSKDSDSFTHVLQHPGEIGHFLKYNAGYMGGQLAEGAAVMGLGALAGSEVPGVGNAAGAVAGLVAKPVVERAILKKVAQFVAEKGMSEEAATAAAKQAVNKKLGAEAGAAIAGGALNTGQELGSIYPDALDQAKQDGRTLTGGDLARVGGSAVAAGAVDTLAERLNLGDALKGVKVAEGAGKSALRQRLEATGKTVLTDAARGGATEAAQTVAERFGAGQSMTDPAAVQDYVDSTAAGVVGGGLTGAGAGLHTQHAAVPHPDAAPGSLSDAVNTMAQPAGPLGRAAQAATEAAAAPTPAPIASPSPVAAPTAVPADATPTDTAPRMAPIVPPWINPATGETTQPDQGTLTATLARHIIQQFDEQGHMRINTGEIADAWGVPKADINRARNAATKIASNAVRNRDAGQGDMGNPISEPNQADTSTATSTPAQPADAATPDQPATVASVPFMVTQKMKAELRALGHTDADIATMNPQQAHDVLRAGEPVLGKSRDLLGHDQPAVDQAVSEQTQAAKDAEKAAAKPTEPSGNPEPLPTTGATDGNERVPGPAAGEAAATGAQAASQADAEPAALGDHRGTGDTAQPDTAVPAAVGGAGAAGDTHAAVAETAKEPETASNWIGADRAFTHQAKGEHDPGQASPEAMAFARGAKAGTTTLETTIRPSGREWHHLYVSDGKGEFSSLSIGSQRKGTLAEAVAAIKDRDAKYADMAAQSKAIRDKETSGHMAVAEKHGFSKGAKLGNIVPNTGKMLRVAHIVADHGNGTFDVQGFAGSREAIIRNLPATDLARAVARHALKNEHLAAEQYLQRRVKVGNSFHEEPFKNAHAVGVAIKRIAADPSHYTIEKVDGGFIGKRRSQLDIEADQALPSIKAKLGIDPAPTAAVKESLTAGQKRTSALLGANVGDTVRTTGMGGEIQPGSTWKIERIDNDGTLHISSPGGGTSSWKRSELEREVRKGATFEKLAPPTKPIDVAAHEAATSPHNDKPEPTQAQKEAGNYELGHLKVHGLDISIENPRGSTRSGVGENGKPWSHVMSDHYGYVRGTVGADGDHVDVYVGPKPEAKRVFVVDQIDQKTGAFDEHKAMIGFADKGAAVRAYRSNFDPGWKVGPVKDMHIDQFKAWLKEGDTSKPIVDTAAKPASIAAVVEQTVDERIAAAEAAGVVLSDADKKTIRTEAARAADFGKRASREMGSSSDPMNKGNAFPLGVGFTTMTKRKSQAIDTSVRRAGEAVKLFGRQKSANATVDALLAGKGTEASTATAAAKREASNEALMRKLMAGEATKFGAFTVSKITKDKDGYPAGIIMAGQGVIKGVNDRIDIAREMFDGSKQALRDMVDRIRAETSLPPAEEAAATPGPTVSTPVEQAASAMDAARKGEGSVADLRAAFERVRDNKDEVKAWLSKLSKVQLAQRFQMRDDTKERMVTQAYRDTLSQFTLSNTISYVVGGNANDAHMEAVQKLVNGLTQADLDAYARKFTDINARREEIKAGQENPTTLEDFQRLAYSKGGEAKLDPEQRATFDKLRADARREKREEEAKRKAVVRQVDTGATGMTLVETKHTQKGHDLFVVRMDDRVERDVYTALNLAAKRLGGHYSSYRGNGAVPGFTFSDRAAAEQFMAVRNGNVDASGQQQARTEAKAEKRAETLSDKADALREKAQSKLNADRKDNTARRARMAASAEADARKDLATAETMAQISKAIEAGKAGMLQFVNARTQVELLDRTLRQAHWTHLRDQGVQWEKAKDMPPTAASITATTLPQFWLTRGDAAVVAKRLTATRSGKVLGQAIAKQIDYGDEYGAAVQANPHKFVQMKQRADGTGQPDYAFFATKKAADAAIHATQTTAEKRGDVASQYVVVKMPRAGKTSRVSQDWAVALAPELAIERKLWAPDFDKKVHFGTTSAQKLMDLLKVDAKGDQQVPYWWASHAEERATLARMGIETNYELREALREYLALRQTPTGEDTVRKLERALVGNKSVGVDFFPTPPAVVQRMVEQADIGPGMRVLEPSAGKGDIAEALRDAADGVTVDTVEMSHALREILDAKGFEATDGDFLQLPTDPVYDRVVMNPPFGNDNGAAHVQHAYDMLKPGGRLVAVMGAGSRGKAEFETWLDSVGGLSEPLPEGSFKSSFRPTGVNTQVVVIDKDGSAHEAARASHAQPVAQFSKDDEPSAEPFYSALTRSVETAKGAPKSADASSWQQWMDGAQRRGEFKQAEREWLGVDAWLAEQKGPVTREQLQQFVRDNQVQVQETELGGPAEALPSGWTVDYDPADEDRAQPWAVKAEDGEFRGFGTSRETAIHDAQDPDARGPADTKFSSYQLPGGTNYRELLLTLPPSNDGMPVGFRVEERDGGWGVVFPDGKFLGGWKTRDAAVASQRRQSGNANFHSSHFEQPNILAHVRFNERTDADGKKVLFLEEVQSDWHQAGRRSGYQTELKELPQGYELKPNSQDNLQLFDPTGRRVGGTFESKADALRFLSSAGVPDAPLKKEWPMLAIKRMVRYAAENGFDRIGWTTGEQQAERYDLGKQVDAVRVSQARKDEQVHVMVKAKGSREFTRLNGDTSAVDKAKLADAIGKDLAEKALAKIDAANRADEDPAAEFSGVDLKVGGEGMQAFYDRMLPNEVNKWAKPFGAKVGHIDVPTGEHTMQGEDITPDMQGAHSLDITPAMRDAALGGLPLFRQDGSHTASSDSNTATPAEEAHAAKVRQIANAAMGKWKGDDVPRLIVVATPEQLPAFAKRDPNYKRGAGMYDGRNIYIVASKHGADQAGMRKILTTMAHEGVGHYGVERIVDRELGDGAWKKIESATDRLRQNPALASASIREVIASVEKRYAGADASTFAREFLAVTAERGVKNGLLDRAVTALRKFLRRVLPDLNLSEHELRQLLVKSDEFMRNGESYAQRVQATQAMSFSKDDDLSDPKPKRAFSDASASIEAIHDQLPQLDRSAYQHVKDWISGKARDLEPLALGGLQLRHVLELASEQKVLEAPAKHYADIYQRMDGDRNTMTQEGAAKVDALNTWARAPGAAGWLQGKLRPEANQLFKFMHAVTQIAIDPTSQYQRLLMRDSRGEQMPWTKELIKERIQVLREQQLGRPGDDKTAMQDEIKELRKLPSRERSRAAKYPELVAAWNALSPKAQEQFVTMREHYKQQSEALEQATIEHIQSLDIPAQNKLAAAALIRKNFADSKVGGVYFPLSRFGDYWLSGETKDGEYVFAKYESAQAQQQAEKRFLAAGATINARGRQDNNYRAKDAISGTFMGDLMGVLRKGNAPESVQNEIYQMYLKALPDLSLRKHGIHRNNVAGYTDDVPRAFASSVFHGAHQVSKARYGWQLQNTLEHMRGTVEGNRGGMAAAQASHADALLGEINRRHDWIMNPTNSKLANKLTSIGFSYYLAASPASALVNLIQVPQITLPVLGAHHGWGAATKVLGSSMRDAIRTGGNIERVLKGEDLMAFKALQQQGTFQRTATHSLAGVAEGDQLRASPAYTKVMNAVSWMFHTSEVINREGTGMAAYRLARARGDSFEKAVKYADEITNGTHGDYSNANRARYMQGNVSKVLLQFKNYSLAMSWLWGRNFYKAFKGETPEVKAIARRTLTGMLGMTGLFAGVIGMPIFNLLRYGAQAVHAATGDDDEPWDFLTEFRSWLAEHLGETAAAVIADGAASQLGANVASRVSMSDLWFRDADKELEGEDAYNAMLQSIAGPLGGMLKNMYVGAKQFNDGHTERGIETMLPTFAKNAVKAVRFAHEGVTSLRGDPIVPDVTAPQALIQAMGFQPTKVAEQQRTNNALMNYSTFIQDRRQGLMNAFAMAQQAGDEEGRGDTLTRIQAFNAKYPEIAIRMSNLHASLRQRARFSAEADNGIHLNRKIADRVRQEVGVPGS